MLKKIIIIIFAIGLVYFIINILLSSYTNITLFGNCNDWSWCKCYGFKNNDTCLGILVKRDFPKLIFN
jgi:hypothetical protein